MILSLVLLSLAVFALANPGSLEARAASPELSADISFQLAASTELTAASLPASLTIACSNCSLTGAASISGGTGTTTPDSNFTVLPSGFNFQQGWIGVAIDNFDFHVEVTFTVQANTTTPFDVPLLAEPKSFSINGLAAMFEPHIIGSVTTSTTVNFSIGFDVSTPAGSAILVPVANLLGTVVVGFNETKITPVFQSPTADIEVNFDIALRTQFAINATMSPQESISLVVYADTPSADVLVTQIINGDAACNPSNSSTTISDLTKVTPTLGVDAGAFITATQPTQLNFSLPLNPLCFQYDSTTHSLVPPGQANTTSGGSSGSSSGGSGSSSGSSSGGSSGGSGSGTGAATARSAPIFTLLAMLGIGIVLV